MKKFTFSCIVLTTWLAVIASLFVMPNTSYAQRISNRGVAIQDSGALEGSNKRILNFSTDLAVDCTTPTAGCTVSSTAGGSTYDSIKLSNTGGQDIDNENVSTLHEDWAVSYETPAAGTNSFSASTNASGIIGIQYTGTSGKIVCFDTNVLIRGTGSRRHEFLLWLTTAGSCTHENSISTTAPQNILGEQTVMYHRQNNASTQGSFFGQANWTTCVALSNNDIVKVCSVELQTDASQSNNNSLVQSSGTSFTATVMN